MHFESAVYQSKSRKTLMPSTIVASHFGELGEERRRVIVLRCEACVGFGNWIYLCPIAVKWTTIEFVHSAVALFAGRHRVAKISVGAFSTLWTLSLSFPFYLSWIQFYFKREKKNYAFRILVEFYILSRFIIKFSINHLRKSVAILILSFNVNSSSLAINEEMKFSIAHLLLFQILLELYCSFWIVQYSTR